MLMIVRPWEITKDVQRYVDLLSKFFEWDFKLVSEKTVHSRDKKQEMSSG